MKAKAANDHRDSAIIWILQDPVERSQLLGCATNAAGWCSMMQLRAHLAILFFWHSLQTERDQKVKTSSNSETIYLLQYN